MGEVFKSENNIICMICREGEPEVLTCCNHNFHEDCLKKWHERIKNECPYCRSFITLNRKLNLFLKSIQNNDKEIDIAFEEEDIKDIFSYLKRSNVDKKVFQYLMRTVKRDSIKGRLLQLASKNGNMIIVKLLLDCGAPVEVKMIYYDWTSLMIASQHGHLEIVKLLLDHGALVEAKNNDGWTPLIKDCPFTLGVLNLAFIFYLCV